MLLSTQKSACVAVRQSVQTVSRARNLRAYARVYSSSTSQVEENPTWKVKMLYDGDCPLCLREVNMLRRRDSGKGNICFVDIADPGYRSEDNAGITFEQSMETIHAILPNGEVVTQIGAFKKLYEVVGLGWVYAATGIPVVEKALNAIYAVWAKYRLPLTGRPELSVILSEKKTCREKSVNK